MIDQFMRFVGAASSPRAPRVLISLSDPNHELNHFFSLDGREIAIADNFIRHRNQILNEDKKQTI